MRKQMLIIAILLSSLANSAAAQAAAVGPNVNIAGEAAPDRQLMEPTIAIDPQNPQVVVAGAQDLRLVAQGFHRWGGYYRSTDGGLTWSSSLLPGFPGDTSPQGVASPLKSFTGGAGGDGHLAFDRLGNAYYLGIAANATTSGLGDPKTFRAFVARYSDDGANFVRATIVADKVADFPTIAVDATGGPNDGNVYVTFDSDGAVFSRSTDGGQTFSPPIQVPGGHFNQGVTVAPDGRIFVVTERCTMGATSCTAGGQILVAKSTDGGLTFGKAVVAATITNDPVPLPGNSFPSATNPQVASDANGVYIVTDDFTAGNANVLFIRSTDGGLSWSSSLRVNDVIRGQHFFPTIAASGGVISVAWYDSRLGQLPDGTITALDVFYAKSTDAGSNFSANLRVTSTSFDPNAVESSDLFILTTPWIGEYITIAASPTAVHAIWTDNRNACDTVVATYGCVDQDAYTATISP